MFDEEPFAKEETQTPSERLREILAKMGQIGQRGERLVQGPGAAPPAPEAPRPREALEGIRRKQKEVEEDLARLVLVLQKG